MLISRDVINGSHPRIVTDPIRQDLDPAPRRTTGVAGVRVFFCLRYGRAPSGPPPTEHPRSTQCHDVWSPSPQPPACTPGRPRCFTRAAAATGHEITIGRPDEEPVDASSILLVMSLGLSRDEDVVLESHALEAETALDDLAALLGTDLDAHEAADRAQHPVPPLAEVTAPRDARAPPAGSRGATLPRTEPEVSAAATTSGRSNPRSRRYPPLGGYPGDSQQSRVVPSPSGTKYMRDL